MKQPGAALDDLMQTLVSRQRDWDGALANPISLDDVPACAKHVLCRAYIGWGDVDGNPMYLIDRTLGYRTWRTAGREGRKDIAPLYRLNLIEEWFTPWSRPCFLTIEGVAVRKKWRKELGYDA